MITLKDVWAKKTTDGKGAAVYIWLRYEVPDGRHGGIGTVPWKVRIPATAANSMVVRDKAINGAAKEFLKLAGEELTNQERALVIDDFLLNAMDAIKKMEKRTR